MVIKRGKKLTDLTNIKSSPKKESNLQRISREFDEKKAQDLAAEKQRLLDADEEKKRMESIVYPYLDNLKDQMDEKNVLWFWAFPDRSGFKKYKNLSYDEMQTYIKKNPEKYANRKIANFSLIMYHRSKDTSYKEAGILFGVGIVMYPIKLNGDLDKKKAWGCDFMWTLKDFKLTKFSLKLLERVMIALADKKMTCTSLTGFPISYIIQEFKKLKYNFDDCLSPLAGL